MTDTTQKMAASGDKRLHGEPDRKGATDNNASSPDPQTTPELTQGQREVLQQMNDFLLQFGDREQMQAGAYLAKYKNVKTCEEICIGLRWDLQREFNNVG